MAMKIDFLRGFLTASGYLRGRVGQETMMGSFEIVLVTFCQSLETAQDPLGIHGLYIFKSSP